jgi:hypothetical protein
MIRLTDFKECKDAVFDYQIIRKKNLIENCRKTDDSKTLFDTTISTRN